MNTMHKKEDEQYIDQEPIEDLNQEERVPEFDEIGTALNGI
ncbi:hypothetical protein [Bacillus sp. USDA818B3_A]|nr:hypothetical protein [Bacillus sp. USDA818B3_A]